MTESSTTDMNSSRPYLMRAMYEWIVDNNLTPYLLVSAGGPDVQVPVEQINNGKIILIKNPFHSLRMDVLNEIFPKARYVNIIRHPHKFVPSTVRIWNIVGTQNAMNNNWVKPSLKEVSAQLFNMLQKIESDSKSLPKERYCEIKFEDLEKNPVKEIKQIYGQLNVEFSDQFEKQISEFLISVQDYQKNKYSIPETDKLEINNILKDWMQEKNYSLD